MNVVYNGGTLKISKRKYLSNNRTALILLDRRGRYYMSATVNCPKFDVPENYVLVKAYPGEVGILETLIEQKIVCDTGIIYHMRYINAVLAKLLYKK